jgi:hypothetical protein
MSAITLGYLPSCRHNLRCQGKGEGAFAEAFMFAELYRLSSIINGAEKKAPKWKIIPPDRPLDLGELYDLFD